MIAPVRNESWEELLAIERDEGIWRTRAHDGTRRSEPGYVTPCQAAAASDWSRQATVKASTTAGSNCVPAHRTSSSSAASGVRGSE